MVVPQKPGTLTRLRRLFTPLLSLVFTVISFVIVLSLIYNFARGAEGLCSYALFQCVDTETKMINQPGASGCWSREAKACQHGLANEKKD